MIAIDEAWVKIMPWLIQNHKDLLSNFLITAVVLAVLHLSAMWISRRMQSKLANQKSVWMESMFYGMRPPTAVIIWLGGLSYSLFVMTDSPIDKNVSYFCGVLIVACLVWFVLRMVNFAERKYSDPTYSRSKNQRDTVRTIARLGKVITIIIGAIIMLQTLGFSVSGLVAFGGVGAAGLAFAAKDALGNFFGGMMIFLNRPFTIGDYIKSPDRQIEGTVEEIGWFSTRVKTLETCPVYVPNGIFSNIVLENQQRRSNRWIRQVVSLSYSDAENILKITAEIKDMLHAHPEIDQKQMCFVDLDKLTPSSLDILICAFTKTTDRVKFQDVQQDVLVKVVEIIERHEAHTASSTTTIHIDNLDTLLKVKKES